MKFLFAFLIISNSLISQGWIRIPDFPNDARDDGIAVSVNGKAYFGLGLKVGWILGGDFYALDVSNNSWSAIANIPAGAERQYCSAFAGPGCFFVFGGDAPNGALNDLYKYDIATNTWSVMTSKPGNGLKGASCLVFSNKIIIMGGITITEGPVSDEVWEYTISTDTWLQKTIFHSVEDGAQVPLFLMISGMLPLAEIIIIHLEKNYTNMILPLIRGRKSLIFQTKEDIILRCKP